MTINAVPFNATGQRATEAQWQTMGRMWAPSGVAADTPAITTSGLTWVVPAGLPAWVHGFLADNDTEPVTVDGTPNNSTLPRLDRIVLRLSTTGKTITPTVIEGTAGAVPQLPVIQAATDISLAYATKPGSGSSQNYTNVVQDWHPVSSDRRRNTWRGTGQWGPGNNSQPVSNWSALIGDGLITRTGASFRLDQPGHWDLYVKASASNTPSGTSTVRVSWPGGPWVDDHGPMDSTLGGRDSTHNLAWSGMVLPSEVGIDHQLQVLVAWTPSSGLDKASYVIDFYANYGG